MQHKFLGSSRAGFQLIVSCSQFVFRAGGVLCTRLRDERDFKVERFQLEERGFVPLLSVVANLSKLFFHFLDEVFYPLIVGVRWWQLLLPLRPKIRGDQWESYHNDNSHEQFERDRSIEDPVNAI